MVKRFSSTLAGLFLCVGASFAQGKISGKVVSQDDGEPVIGASIMVQGTKALYYTVHNMKPNIDDYSNGS